MQEVQRSLLIVDDNPDLLELLQEGLSTHFTLHVAHDGIEGLNQAISHHPDCAIIDVKMPGLDGFQLIRALRGDSITQDIPLIILTAMPEEHGLEPGLISGTDCYLTKPVLPSELIESIHQVLAISQQEREARQRHLAEEEQ